MEAENYTLKYIKKKIILKCNNCSQFVYCIFDQLNEALVSIRDFFQKQNLTD